MTAYAYKESSSETCTVSVEIKCYNSRFLDLYVHLPHWLSSLEARIRSTVSSKFSRGKVELVIRIKDSEQSSTVSVNKNAALSYKKAIEELSLTLSMEEKPNLTHILGLEGVLEVDYSRDPETYWPLIEGVFIEAMEMAEQERIREGKHTKSDILSHISILEGSVECITGHIPEMEAVIKENLRTRFAEFFGDKIDETRVLTETSVLLMKYGISEELSRISAHLSEFRVEMERNDRAGKKLDFLSQEINREVNTIGSKTPIIEVSRAVIDMKNALENIREQLRNVE